MLPSSCLLVILLSCYFVNCNKIVKTDKGKVQGHIVTSKNIESLAFLGIPYARAMTGKNRFKAPLQTKPWIGILKADRKVVCLHWFQGIVSGDEDCLVVNVFTPRNINEKLLPVIVVIPGGAFRRGHGWHSGTSKFLERHIIQVTFNSRLGASGYLCLKNEEAPGNAGLKDQVAALKWVQRNIAHFGGDPAQVTLMGNSMGGAQAHLLVLSKMAKGLFQRVIINGGSALSYWALDHYPISTAQYLSKMLNITNFKNDSSLLTHFLQNVGSTDLNTKSGQYNEIFFSSYVKKGIFTCVEQPIYGTKPFLSEHPFHILSENQNINIPIILSFNSFEGFPLTPSLSKRKFKREIEKKFEDFLPLDLKFSSNDAKIRTAEMLKSAYNTTREFEYLNYFSDSLVTYSILKSAKLHSKYTTVYLFEFAVASPMGHSYNGKAGHGSFFSHIFQDNISSDTKVRLAVERATTLVENFVKFGNPTPNETRLLPVTWEALHPKEPMTYLMLDNDNITILKNPISKKMKLWDKIYKKFRLL